MRYLLRHLLHVSLQVVKDVGYGVDAGHAIKHGRRPATQPLAYTATIGSTATAHHRENTPAARPAAKPTTCKLTSPTAELIDVP